MVVKKGLRYNKVVNMDLQKEDNNKQIELKNGKKIY